MTEHAEVTTVLYSDLTEEEEAILREFEREVVGTLLKHAVNARPIWTSRTDDLDRFVQCLIANPQSTESKKPRILLELPSRELTALSRGDLSVRFEESLRHPWPEDGGV
jgi:hypothetical protein